MTTSIHVIETVRLKVPDGYLQHTNCTNNPDPQGSTKLYCLLQAWLLAIEKKNSRGYKTQKSRKNSKIKKIYQFFDIFEVIFSIKRFIFAGSFLDIFSKTRREKIKLKHRKLKTQDFFQYSSKFFINIRGFDQNTNIFVQKRMNLSKTQGKFLKKPKFLWQIHYPFSCILDHSRDKYL